MDKDITFIYSHTHKLEHQLSKCENIDCAADLVIIPMSFSKYLNTGATLLLEP